MLHRVLILILLTAASARAEVYPWVENSSIYPLPDPHVDMALRVKLIDEAQDSIRIETYDQRTDSEVGLPILHALRRAADRGVKIWFLQARLAQTVYDRYKYAEKMLADPDLTRPARVITFGGLDNLRFNWFVFDSVHEKIFIIDEKIVITGGRNHGDVYLKWLDSGYAVTGPIVGDYVKAFRKTWNNAAVVENIARPKNVVGYELPDPSKNDKIALAPKQRAALDDVFARENEKRIEKARLISNDFLASLRTGKYNGGRRQLIPDDILDEAVKLIEDAKEIRISTLYLGLHPKMKTALVNALARGAKVRALFNGPEASGEVVPGSLSYTGSLDDAYDLMRAGDFAAATFQKGSLVYLHKKTLIIDDHVFVGSHNFNRPSTFHNTELSMLVHDADFAAAMRRDYDADFMFLSKPLTMRDARAEIGRTAPGRWLAKLMEGFF